MIPNLKGLQAVRIRFRARPPKTWQTCTNVYKHSPQKTLRTDTLSTRWGSKSKRVRLSPRRTRLLELLRQ